MSNPAVRASSDRAPALRAKLLLALISFCVTIGVAEFVVRAYSCSQAEVDDFELVRKRFLGDKLSIFPELGDAADSGLRPGSSVSGGMHINSLGFRGREVAPTKASGTRRVLFLGGSAVFSSAVSDDTKTWPVVVEWVARERGAVVEVLNGGVPGFVAEQSIARFEKMFLPLSIDVAVLYNDHNDMITRRIARLEYDPRQEAPVTVDGAFEELLSHSAIWLRMRAYLTYREKQTKVAQQIQSSDQKPEDELARRQRIRDELGAKAAAEAKELASDSSNPYFSGADLDKHEANVMRFIKLCRDHGITPVLASESVSFDVDAGEEVYRKKGAPLLPSYFPSYPWFREMFHAYHDRIEAIAKRENVLFLPTAKTMPHGDEMFADHVHQTIAGCDALGRVVAGALADAGLLGATGNR